MKTTVEYSGEVLFFPNKKEPVAARIEHVYGHPRFEDGKLLITSQIVSVIDGVIETKNTIYKPRCETK